MVGWHHRLNGHEFEQALGDGEGQGSLAFAVHGVAKSQTGLNLWTTINYIILLNSIATIREGNGTPLQYSCLEKSHGQRSLVGCSPWGWEELDTIERLHFHFSLSCIGEGNGNPLQCSCLENPRDGGAWWAAVYGVPQSRTRLKWCSSSSNSHYSESYLWFLSTVYLDCPISHWTKSNPALETQPPSSASFTYLLSTIGTASKLASLHPASDFCICPYPASGELFLTYSFQHIHSLS